MTEKSVLEYSRREFVLHSLDNSTQIVEDKIDYGYTPLQVAGLLCFLVGMIQVTRDQSFRLILISILSTACHVRFSARNYCVPLIRLPSQRLDDRISVSDFYSSS